MKQRNYFLLPVILISGLIARPAVAQNNVPRPVTLYYNSACELTTPEKALFIRETSLDFENMVFSGISRDYAIKDHSLMSEGFFDHGVNKGLHSNYFENGKLQSTIEYADDGFILWELTDDKDNHEVVRGTGKFVLDYFSIGTSNSSGVTLDQGTLSGEFLGGKRTGIWIYKDKSGVKTDEEIYEGGKFLKRNSILPSGTTSVQSSKKTIYIDLTGILTEAFNVDPTSFSNLNQYIVQYCPSYDPSFRRWLSYPGGMKKLLLIIAVGLRTEIDDNITIKLTIDENGKFVKVRPPFVLGSDFGDEVKAIIKPHENKILPAMRDGKPYAFTMKLPIANSQQWIQYLETATDDDVNAYLDELNVEQ
jgi:hypothetical protein